VSNILPGTITAGLTLDRVVALDCYPASEGWALYVALRGPDAIDLTATVEDGKHKLRAEAAVTAGWAPGRYSYTARVTKGDDVFQADAGVLEILPDLNSQLPGFDGRTHAERVLDAIEAVLAHRATLDQERYRINNRELYRTPIAELLKLRDTYRAEVQQEQMRARGGKYFGRAVRVIL
jgi:hypothetical protein